MKKIILSFILCFCIISLCFLQSSAVNEAYSWYCKRNTDHSQPILEEKLQFIENYGGYYVDKKHADYGDEKVIYLTFDAGYENGNIEKILDVLKEEDVKAAFFILSNLVVKNSDLVKRMSDEGHNICNHTSKHFDITKFQSKDELKSELEKLEVIYKETTGKEMQKYFRPPEGKFDEKSMKYLHDLGYKTIFWSFAYADWDNNNQMTGSEAKEKIFENLHNGEIMLLHPTSETNAMILKDVIRQLKSDGYTFATLDNLTQ